MMNMYKLSLQLAMKIIPSPSDAYSNWQEDATIEFNKTHRSIYRFLLGYSNKE